jgi:hypothetical protein
MPSAAPRSRRSTAISASIRWCASTRPQPDGGAHRISDSLGATAFRATPLYADYYARVGLDHRARLPLHVDDRCS